MKKKLFENLHVELIMANKSLLKIDKIDSTEMTERANMMDDLLFSGCVSAIEEAVYRDENKLIDIVNVKIEEGVCCSKYITDVCLLSKSEYDRLKEIETKYTNSIGGTWNE